MRWLVAQPGPNFSVHDRFVGWVEALRNAGEQVFEFDLSARLTFYDLAFIQVADGQFRKALESDAAIDHAVNGLYATVMRVRPHVLMLVSGFFIPPELPMICRAAGVRVVFVSTESPYEDDRQLTLAEHCDLVLLDEPASLPHYRELTRTEYFPQAYRPTVHHPGSPLPELSCDVAFVGTGYPSRVHFLEAVDLRGLDVVLAGNWKLLHEASPLRPFVAHDLDECLDNERTADLYRSARVGLNLYRREASPHATAEGTAIGPREVEMAACGLFFLRDPRGEGDELLDMLPTFTTPEEASDLLRWWLRHDGDREAAAFKAREAIADRTFDALAARLLRLLNT